MLIRFLSSFQFCGVSSSRDGRDFFLMACWLAMAAAEVDGFSYGISFIPILHVLGGRREL
jgi:hypothetical protein